MDEKELEEAKGELNVALAQAYLRGAVDMLDAFNRGLALVDVDRATPEVRSFSFELARTTGLMKDRMIQTFADLGVTLDG